MSQKLKCPEKKNFYENSKMVGDYYYEGSEDYDDGTFWITDNLVTRALLRHHFVNVIKLIKENNIRPCEFFFETLKCYILLYNKERVKSIFLKDIVTILLRKKLIDLNYLSFIEQYLNLKSEPLTDDKYSSVTYYRKTWFLK